MQHDPIIEVKTGDSFFISFTDVVSLLLIFFIYLISLSSFNSAEIELISQNVGSEYKVESMVQEITKNTDQDILADPLQILIGMTEDNLLQDESIRLSLDQDLLFKPGSAKLINNGGIYLQRLAETLSKRPYKIIVEGHSDSTPINTDLFPSNWHLSSMRAAEVTYMLQKLGVPSEYLSSRGFGATQPIVNEAKTSADHKKNRRVNIYIQPLVIH